jgi:hypothetical protein
MQSRNLEGFISLAIIQQPGSATDVEEESNRGSVQRYGYRTFDHEWYNAWMRLV